MESSLTRRRLAILMAPPSLWLVLLLVMPVVTMVLFTFRAGSFGQAAQQFTLNNYAAFLQNQPFQSLLARSAGVAAIVALLSVVLAYPVAYYLSFSAGSRRFTLLTLIIIPAWTSYLLRVLAWKIILGSGGVLNTVLASLGLAADLGSLFLYNRTAVIITLVYTWIPFVALPIYAALERIEPSLFEAARDLGARPWNAFLRVTLPLSLPGVIAGFLFVFIPTVGEYVTPALVGGPRGIMYGNLVQDQFLNALNWPMGSVMSLAMLLGVLLPILLFSRFVRLTELAGL
jgi:spermidine/putrescine transport system permease protein